MMGLRQLLQELLAGAAREQPQAAPDPQTEKLFAETVWLEVQKQTLLGAVKKVEDGA